MHVFTSLYMSILWHYMLVILLHPLHAHYLHVMLPACNVQRPLHDITSCHFPLYDTYLWACIRFCNGCNYIYRMRLLFITLPLHPECNPWNFMNHMANYMNPKMLMRNLTLPMCSPSNSTVRAEVRLPEQPLLIMNLNVSDYMGLVTRVGKQPRK